MAWVRAQYHWWTAKEWASHRSHLDFFHPPESPGEMLEEPSYLQKVARNLPGIGTLKAEAVAVHFESIRAMAVADEKEWMKIKGIGPKVARSLVEVMSGKGNRR